MEKQIEEMARILCKPTANKGNCERCGFHKQCSKFDDARDLYNAGYRKQSDTAKEIFAEVEGITHRVSTPVGEYTVVPNGRYAELKKKYTEAYNGKEKAD